MFAAGIIAGLGIAITAATGLAIVGRHQARKVARQRTRAVVLAVCPRCARVNRVLFYRMVAGERAVCGACRAPIVEDGPNPEHANRKVIGVTAR